MKTLNRFALIVRPGEPYIEWAAKAAEETIADVRKDLWDAEPSVYLLPESKAADLSHSTFLKGQWRSIFKEELEGWFVDEKVWPSDRTEAMFRTWFRLELATVVYERGKGPFKLEG